MEKLFVLDNSMYSGLFVMFYIMLCIGACSD